MSAPDTPHAFIAAQLDAEQAAAEAAIAGGVVTRGGMLIVAPEVAKPFALTTLRRVAADRRVLELHESCGPCPTIRAFVSRYPDAPGFREEWT